MSDALKRGACPALSAPMLTGDGWLSRIALSDAISPAQLTAIAALGEKHGNGIIDISARGNLQLRGLTPASAQALEADIRALDLPLREGLAVETGPLAGIDPFEIADPRPIAAAIRDNITAVLAPKMTVIIDGGGQILLDDLLADIRLNARNRLEWTLSLGGTAKTARIIGTVGSESAVQAIMHLLHGLAEKGPAARGRDLATNDARQWLNTFLTEKNEAVSSSGPELSEERVITALRASGERETAEHEASFLLPVKTGRRCPAERMRGKTPTVTYDELYAIRIKPAFGQCTAAEMIALCEAASREGMEAVRPAPDHSLLFIGTAMACNTLLEWAASHDFITSPTDPRSSIAACPGKPSCASAGTATRDIAQDIASQCGRLFDGSFTLHISGCAKGCAHPSASLMTLAATAEGRLRIIQNGKASDAPQVEIPARESLAAFRRLADLVQISRKTEETSADCIARLGPPGLKTAFTQEYP